MMANAHFRKLSLVETVNLATGQWFSLLLTSETVCFNN